MSRTCPDCTRLKDQASVEGEPHEYLVPTGRSKSSDAVFYRCLLCNTFLTFAPEGDLPRWNPGFRPHLGGHAPAAQRLN